MATNLGEMKASLLAIIKEHLKLADEANDVELCHQLSKQLFAFYDAERATPTLWKELPILTRADNERACTAILALVRYWNILSAYAPQLPRPAPRETSK